MKPHPYAELFPMMGEDDLRAMADDIKTNGLVDPITPYKKMILDGRNRHRACELAGVTPQYSTPFEGNDAEALAFVLSKNLNRRHLTESQRAMVAANLANMDHGGHRKGDQAANLPLDIPHISQGKAAEMLNVGERTVRDAKKVLEHGSAELKAAVNAGEVAASAAAEVAELPKSEQKKLVAEGPAAVKAKASELRHAKKKPELVSQPIPAPVATEPVDIPDVDEGAPASPGDPCEMFCEGVSKICRDLDAIGMRIEAIKDSPYSHFVHWSSAKVQVKNGRESLWQGRPLYACPYCRVAGDVQPACRCCRGLNVTTKSSYKAGVAAVGEGSQE